MTTSAPATRRLSVGRLIIAVVVTGAVVTAGIFWGRSAITDATTPTVTPWFASYVDVTATPALAFEAPVNSAGKNVVLSFVVSSPASACVPSWGAAYSLDEADSGLDLDRRIARLEQQGGEAVVSFGGQANSELAVDCTDAAALERAYASVVTRYSLSTIDLDLEGSGLDSAASLRRATAIAGLQAAQRTAGSNLAVWLTLPVTPDGLTVQGTDEVAEFLAAGVDIAGVNAMTMDFGDSLASGTSMADGSIAALDSVHRQLGILYSNAGTSLTGKTLWSKVGATPMIGQNDTAGEVLTIADAKKLNRFVTTNALGRASMWSLNRDKECGPNYVDVAIVSDSCSGIAQGLTSFAGVLGEGIAGFSKAAATATTSPEPTRAAVTDDPATSPYAIWSPASTYLAGTKIVWHRNVYQAKWWTKGDLPDNPVLQASDTPWSLIGPVLPGEKPVALPTLPAGTYPNWAGTATYQSGDRVLLAGVPFEAKWWTNGDSPEAASVDPDSSPWVALTAAQVAAVAAAAHSAG